MSEEISRIEAREQRAERARHLTLMSDVFMSVALNDTQACQYVIRILTGIEDLDVQKVRTQYRIANIDSRDVILDILAEDSQKRLYNLEIQRSDAVDHIHRVRLHGSLIDAKYIEKGKKYEDLPIVYVIYISETSIFGKRRAVSEIKHYVDDPDTPYDDGRRILYVNTAVNDGSEAAKLMQYFKTSDPDDMEHGALSERVHHLKSTKGGLSEMCKVTEEIFNEGKAEGRAEGRTEEKQATARNLFKLGIPVETIAKAVEVNINLVKEWLSGNGNTSTAG